MGRRSAAAQDASGGAARRTGAARRGGARRGRSGPRAAGTARPTRPRRARRSGGGYRGLPVPTIIAHRGASGYRPEHTLGSYQLALDMGARRHRAGPGAHQGRPSRLPSRERHHRHDRCRRPPRVRRPQDHQDRRRRLLHRLVHRGLHPRRAEDAARQGAHPGQPPATTPSTTAAGRSPPSRRCCAGPTRRAASAASAVWLHVETKHPTYFRELGLGLEERLAKLLRRYGRHAPNSPRLPPVLRAEQHPAPEQAGRHPARGAALGAANTRPWDFVEAGDPRTVADLVKPGGPEVDRLVRPGHRPDPGPGHPEGRGRQARPRRPRWSRDAHAEGLILHPYTMRNENTFLPAELPQGHGPERLRRRLRRLQGVLRDRHRRHLHRQPGHRPAGPRGLRRRLSRPARRATDADR